ncbi:hypothetical protein [Hymenobacter yonginensis]|uniref:Lipoprotein n=1 Tax=Hymenobacter yonginensis TaxID=748197 RepID=A0ABY7PRT9_9BACT|nr:hypothetical protein [Hymenobacter yonginensis]WBO85529.1 hypothetical protein O9Z63_04620 [Hymenobacter yonginensis]
MFRTLRLGLGLAAASVAVGSCISPPEFPETPSIEFKSLTVARQLPNPGDTTPADSVIITLGFKDGDGDLGLTQEEYENPPYQRLNADGTLNPNHWNYIIKLFVKNSAGQFVPYTRTPNGLEIRPEAYYGQFPHLEPNADKKAPLEGDLRFGQRLSLGSPFFPGQEVRYEITIKDRALNTSNTVTTSSFVVVR